MSANQTDIPPKKATENLKAHRRMVPLRYVLTPFAIIFSAVIVLALFGLMAPKPTKNPVEVKAPLVSVMTLESQSVTFDIQSQGSVMPRTKTTLISEVSGQVIQVSDKFQVGGFFKKGEVLLVIDDISYQVALLRAQSQLESAQAQLIEEQARSEQAEDEWLLTGKTIEQAPILALRLPQLKKAQAGVLAAKADLREANIKLARTKIIAPYDAMLSAKQVDIGQYVSTGSSLATTFAVDYAEIRLPIKQRDLAFLNVSRINQQNEQGAQVELYYLLGGKKYSWTAHITRYEGVVDSMSRVYYFVAKINDPYGVLASSEHDDIHMGTFVNANISGKSVANVTAIPIGAVYSGNTVYLVDNNNRLVIETINTLRTDEHYAYSLDEFPNNKRLILTKLASPITDMKLRVDGELVKSTKAENLTEQTADE